MNPTKMDRETRHQHGLGIQLAMILRAHKLVSALGKVREETIEDPSNIPDPTELAALLVMAGMGLLEGAVYAGSDKNILQVQEVLPLFADRLARLNGWVEEEMVVVNGLRDKVKDIPVPEGWVLINKGLNAITFQKQAYRSNTEVSVHQHEGWVSCSSMGSSMEYHEFQRRLEEALADELHPVMRMVKSDLLRCQGEVDFRRTGWGMILEKTVPMTKEPRSVTIFFKKNGADEQDLTRAILTPNRQGEDPDPTTLKLLQLAEAVCKEQGLASTTEL